MSAPKALRHVSWRDLAACREIIPELGFDPFFPDDGEVVDGIAWESARAICRGCPVVSECLEDALETEKTPVVGFRGGESPQGRRRLRRERRTAAKKVAA